MVAPERHGVERPGIMKSGHTLWNSRKRVRKILLKNVTFS